jgi:hypothetical protein
MSEPTSTPRGLVAFVVVGTLLFAVGTVWPFWNAWRVHDTAAFRVSQAWALANPVALAIVGGHPHIESDWFPKGGEADGVARYRHKVGGDLRKLDIEVIVHEVGGDWRVTRAAYEDAGAMHELAVDPEG